MSNILVRMGVVVGVLAAVQLGFRYVFHVQNPVVVEPLKPLDDFPRLANWKPPAIGPAKSRNSTRRSSTTPRWTATCRGYTPTGTTARCRCSWESTTGRRSGCITILSIATTHTASR